MISSKDEFYQSVLEIKEHLLENGLSKISADNLDKLFHYFEVEYPKISDGDFTLRSNDRVIISSFFLFFPHSFTIVLFLILETNTTTIEKMTLSICSSSSVFVLLVFHSFFSHLYVHMHFLLPRWITTKKATALLLFCSVFFFFPLLFSWLERERERKIVLAISIS